MALEDDIKTGVDAEWIADSRLSLRELLRSVASNTQCTEDDLIACVRQSAKIADTMRDERGKRGGLRNASDPREMMALVQENMPMILQFFEKMGEMGEKREKRRGG